MTTSALTPVLLSLISAALLSGCAVTTAGVSPGDERNMVRSIEDVNAERAIEARMKRAYGYGLSGVNVEVAEGIVLLAGNVLTPESKKEAERIAWSGPNVIKVGNEIQLRTKQTPLQDAKDGLLQQAVRTRLITDSKVKGRNISMEVQDGKVYLLGVARTPQELERAAYIASTTKGTKEVISYVKVVGDPVLTPSAHTQAPSYAAGERTFVTPQAPNSYEASPAQPSYRPLPQALSRTPEAPAPRPMANAPQSALPAPLPGALPDTEPYYVDPVTKQRIELPPGVVPIPYVADEGPGSLGAGAKPPPGGAPAPYYLDPNTNQKIPVVFLSNGQFVMESRYLIK